MGGEQALGVERRNLAELGVPDHREHHRRDDELRKSRIGLRASAARRARRVAPRRYKAQNPGDDLAVIEAREVSGKLPASLSTICATSLRSVASTSSRKTRTGERNCSSEAGVVAGFRRQAGQHRPQRLQRHLLQRSCLVPRQQIDRALGDAGALAMSSSRAPSKPFSENSASAASRIAWRRSSAPTCRFEGRLGEAGDKSYLASFFND